MFQSIDHVALIVRDMDDGLSQFTDVYGIEPWGGNTEAQQREYGVDTAYFDVGETVLELVSPVESVGRGQFATEFLQEQGEGVFHVAYEVSELATAAATLEERGVRVGFWEDEPVEGFSGVVMTCHPEDTIVPMQIVEPV
jgi:methylmalonyl-CoA/ethylmalonyl-CoA epimerase